MIAPLPPKGGVWGNGIEYFAAAKSPKGKQRSELVNLGVKQRVIILFFNF
jgi:hypothetical protein